MRAILAMDMPKVCADCEYLLKSTDGYNYCGLTQCFCSKDLDAEKEKEPWCPLRPMPNKDEPRPNADEYEKGWCTGWNDCLDEIWNDCLDEITGETE